VAFSLFRKKYRTIGVDEAKRMLRDGAVLIDVRSRGEWNSGHAREARHIPLDQLEGKLGSLKSDVPVVAICHSGMRSSVAARTLAKRGYQVASVRGGMMAWNRA
jgi:rhodanese-related sulfurtransferase